MRLLHAWFYWFQEHSIRMVYRVIAVMVGSVATALGAALVLRAAVRVSLTGSLPILLPVAVAIWALLGKIEGDDRDAHIRPSPPTSGDREPRRPLPGPAPVQAVHARPEATAAGPL